MMLDHCRKMLTSLYEMKLVVPNLIKTSPPPTPLLLLLSEFWVVFVDDFNLLQSSEDEICFASRQNTHENCLKI